MSNNQRTPGPEHGSLAAQRRLERQRLKRQRARQEILQAARGVVLAKGVAETTLEAVAVEVGMSKTALYYYFPSKDAMLVDLVYGIFADLSEQTHAAVEREKNGTGAVRALIAATLGRFFKRIDDFRLAYLSGQVLRPGSVKVAPEQLERVRPLNTLAYAGTAERLAAQGPNRAGVDPRLMAFLAQVSALGVLTMKGMVESVDDPLIYSDEELQDALAAIFAAAAEPAVQK